VIERCSLPKSVTNRTKKWISDAIKAVEENSDECNKNIYYVAWLKSAALQNGIGAWASEKDSPKAFLQLERWEG